MFCSCDLMLSWLRQDDGTSFSTNMSPELKRCSVLGLTLLATATVPAQSSLKLSSLTPGTEWTIAVTNGDFQAQGPLVGGQHPNPTGWSGYGEVSADPGTNMVRADFGIVAKGCVSGGGPVGLRQRQLILEPATDYVLSAYLWNFGDAANYVHTVVDFMTRPANRN